MGMVASGGLGVECRSPARWFPLICGRGQGGSVPPPLPIPPDTGEECGREAALGSGAAEGWEGRLMGTGTDLLLAVVAPMPGTGYVFNKSLLDDIRDERGWGSGRGRETRTILDLVLTTRISPFSPPRQPL